MAEFINNMPFNWFDVVIIAVLATGLVQGRKHGMSEELIGVLKWGAIVFGCSAIYRTVGLEISHQSTFGLLLSYLTAYLGGALVIAIAFSAIKRMIGGKIVGSDVFGPGEYYLGMVAGMARFTFVLLAALAVLNARLYSKSEVLADLQYQNKEYGSNFFPGLHTVQEQVFEKSFSGHWIHTNLAFLLIQPTPPGGGKELKRRELELP
jgi:uncharacterized membrane protein required for colicin V production